MNLRQEDDQDEVIERSFTDLNLLNKKSDFQKVLLKLTERN